MLAKLMIIFVIALSAMAVLGGYSPLNSEALQQKLNTRSLQSAVHGLVMAESNYQYENNTQVPLTGWQAAFRRDGLRIPVLTALDVNYAETSGKGRYFCFTSEVGARASVLATLAAVHKNFAENGTYESYLNDHCGATSSAAEADWPTLNDLSMTIYTGS